MAYEDIDPQLLLEAMTHDKKAVDGVVRFILLNDIGAVKYRQEVPLEVLQELLAQYA